MATKNSIQVAIKVRPLQSREKDVPCYWKVVDNSIQLKDGPSEPYFFDHIFDQDAHNQIIFDKMAKNIVHSAIHGFNGTIFAYGQTSSGKTYTMMGDDNNPGVQVLAAKEIFKEIEKTIDRQFLLRVGYIEIYNEKIYDLLNKKNSDLKIHETASGIVSVSNCEEQIITSQEDLLQFLCLGNKERTTGETNMNERSSRSHAIFRIIIESQKMDKAERAKDDAITQSILNLVDLAGSERADQTGARGARLKEGGHINKSLLFLSNVIKQLSENENEKFISYRDSKLTRILQASLGGNALTSIICTIKPTAVEETQSTLSFAMRAKTIKNKPQVNEIVPDATMMKRLQRKIKDLESNLAEQISKNESQIKVGQLEQRLKNELLKIISFNSLQNVRTQKEKLRRRTWCPATSANAATLPESESQLQQIAPASMAPPIPSRLPSLPKHAKCFTPQISLRTTAADMPPPVFTNQLPTPQIVTLPPHAEDPEEHFEPGEICKFEMMSSYLSPKSRQRLDDFTTPKDGGLRSKLSITPRVSSYGESLETMKSELLELQEFTNLENKVHVDHDAFGAMKQKLDTLAKRNAMLESSRIELINTKIELSSTKESLNNFEKRCDELQITISKLTISNQNANSKIAKYEQELTELKQAIAKLEVENRGAVSLDFEFQRHKTKTKLRENDLIEALAEKEKEIAKLEKSLSSLTQKKLQISKEDLMQLSRGSKEFLTQADGNICVKCEDLQRLLDENKKVQMELEKLTLAHKELELTHKLLTEESTTVKDTLEEAKRKANEDATTVTNLRLEISALNQKFSTIQQENEKLTKLHTELESNYQQATEDVDSLKTSLETLTLAHKELQVAYTLLTEDSAALRVKNDEKLSLIQQENEKLTKLHTELQSNYQQATDELDSLKSSLKEIKANEEGDNTSIKDLQLEIANLNEKLATNRQENEKVQSGLKKLTDEHMELQRHYKQTKDAESAYKLCVTAIKNKVVNIKKENREVEGGVEKLQEMHEEMLLTHDQVLEASQSIRASLEELTIKDFDNQALIANLRIEIKELKEELATIPKNKRAQIDLKKLTKEHSELQTSYTHTKNAATSLQMFLSKLTAQTKTDATTITNLREEINKGQTDLEKLKLAHKALLTKHMQAIEETASLKNSSIEINTKKDADETTINNLRLELAALKQQNEKLVGEQADVQLQFEVLQREYDDLSNQLMDSLQEEETLRDRLKNVESKLNTESQTADAKQSSEVESKSLKTEINGEKSELGNTSRTTRSIDFDSSRASQTGASRNAESMRSSGVCLDEDMMQSFKTADTAQETSADLYEQNQDLKRQIKDLIATNECLREENKSLLESTERNINEMREEISKLSAELFEKSLFIEKCACEDYQTQIENLKQERLEVTIICEQMHEKIAKSRNDDNTASNNTLCDDVDLEENADDKKAQDNDCLKSLAKELSDGVPLEKNDDKKTQDNECLKALTQELQAQLDLQIVTFEEQCREFAQRCFAAEESINAMQEEHQQKLSELQTAYETIKTQLETETKRHTEEKSRLELELYANMESSENDFRQTMQRSNIEWTESKDHYEETIRNLEQQLELQGKKCEILQTALDKNDKVSQELREDALESQNQLKKDIAEMQRKSNETEVQLRELEEQCKEAVEKRMKVEEINRGLTDVNKLLKEECDALNVSKQEQHQSQKLLEEEISALKESQLKFSDGKSKVKDLEDQNERLQKEHDESRNKLKDLEKLIDRLENEKETLKKEHDETENKIKNIEELNVLFQTEKETLKKEHDECGNKIKNLETLNESLQNEKDTLKNEQDKSTTKVKDLEELNDRLQNEKATLKKEHDESSNKVKDLEDLNERLQNEKVTLKQEHDEINKKVNNLQELNDRLKNEKDKLKKEYDVIENKVKNLEDLNDRLQNEKETFKNEHDESKKSLQRVSVELKTAELNFSVVNSKLEKLQTEKETILEKQDKLLQSKQEEECKQKSLQDDYLKLKEVEQKIEDVNQKIKNLQLTNSNLLLENDILEKQNKNLSIEKEKLSMEVKKCATEIEVLRRERDSLKKENSNLSVENEKLSMEIKKSANEIEVLWKECDILEQEHKNLSVENEKLSVNVKKCATEIEVLRKERDSLEKENSSLSVENEKLSMEIKKCATKIEVLQKERDGLVNSKKEQDTKHKILQTELSKLAETSKLLEQEKSDLQNQFESKNKATQEKLQHLLQTVETLTAEKQQLEQTIVTLKSEYENTLKSLKQEKGNLSLALDQQKLESAEIANREATLVQKIQTLTQELHETEERMLAVEQLRSEYVQLEKRLTTANDDKQNLKRHIETLEAQLADAQQNERATWQAQIQQLQAEAATSERERKSLLLERQHMQTQIFDEHYLLLKKEQENKSCLEELELKCKTLEQSNTQLQQENSSLAEQLQNALRQVATCETLRAELERLRGEHSELQSRLKQSTVEAAKCRQALEEDNAQHMKTCDNYCALLTAKKSFFKEDKEKLEHTISSLLSEKKVLEEKLFITQEIAMKRESEASRERAKPDSVGNTSLDSNVSISSPRSQLSLDRFEIQQLKSVHALPDDRLSPMQQKATLERKNRRLSAHDERRSQSFCMTRDVACLTDPSDKSCNCAELDKKLQESERNLFIRESQVEALTLELKHHPLKAQCAGLLKRLEDEQETHRIDQKRYKQVISDQKIKLNSALEALAKHKELKPPDTPPKILENAETQTNCDLNESLHKLQAKYNDLKNICRSRGQVIRNMEAEAEAALKENISAGHQGMSSLETGRLNALQSQCEALKKELKISKEKYEKAKIVLAGRHDELKKLRALLGLNVKELE